MHTKVTIYDVAKRAGVSITTVSRFMNDNEKVSDKTKNAVRQAIKDLKFKPNTKARAFSRNTTDTIGLILPGFRGDYFGSLMEGVDEEARESGLQVMVSKATGTKAKLECIDKLLYEGRVDGAIMMLDEFTEKVLDKLKGLKSPVIILDEDVGHRRLDNILIDNRTGSWEATTHLIEAHKIRNLLFVGGPKDNIDSEHRGLGFQDAVKSAGLEVSADCMFNTEYEFKAGFELAAKIIPRLKHGEKWGIVAANDDLAYGIVTALQQKNIKVPEEVAIIGYDNSPITRLCRPQISSVYVPLKEIGHTAVKMLLERLQDNRKEPKKVILKGNLVLRESCGCKKSKKEDI